MKLQSFLFVVCFLSITSISYSQEKGYYSIGNNRQKLFIKNDRRPPERFLRVEKGYYHIVPNRTKLRRSLWENVSAYRGVPVVTKGYYSIGNNIQKLKNY